MADATRDVAVPGFPVLVVLLPFAAVFAFRNCDRTVTAILAPYLIEQCSVSAGQRALLIAIFLITPRKAQAANGVTEPGQ